MRLPLHVLDHQVEVEQALRKALEGLAESSLPLDRMMRYQLGWATQEGGEETRQPPARAYGSMCLEAARAGRSPELAPPAASAIELFCQAITVHEEMQLADRRDDERPAVWWVWGPAQAINVGNGLHAMARLAVLSLQGRGLSAEATLNAVQELDTMALRFYEGQHMELAFQERIDVTEGQYLRLAEAKYGSLLGGAMALGARAASASDQVVEALRLCGSRLGLAAQLYADMTEVWDAAHPQGASPRMLNKTKLFPVVHAWEKSTVAQKRALGEVYFKRVLEREDVEQVRLLLDEAGARSYTQQKASAIAGEAMESLEAAGLPLELQQRWTAVASALAGEERPWERRPLKT